VVNRSGRITFNAIPIKVSVRQFITSVVFERELMKELMKRWRRRIQWRHLVFPGETVSTVEEISSSCLTCLKVSLTKSMYRVKPVSWKYLPDGEDLKIYMPVCGLKVLLNSLMRQPLKSKLGRKAGHPVLSYRPKFSN
jgi:hypothetical protein